MDVDEAVPEEAMDYEEIFRRGGRNVGDEDFAVFRSRFGAARLRHLQTPGAGWTVAGAGCGGAIPRDVATAAGEPVGLGDPSRTRALKADRSSICAVGSATARVAASVTPRGWRSNR
jgi:hypothetical protein